MKLLDWYILRKFLGTFTFTLVALTVTVALIDFTEKNGQFVEHQLGYKEIMAYYGYGYIPFIVNFSIPLGAFIATVFVTARLAQRTEMIAMGSSGIGFLRVLRPYLVGAIAISLCHFLLAGWGLARANSKRVAFETKYINTCEDRIRRLHMCIAPNRYLYVAHYTPRTQVATRITIETIEANQLFAKLSAKSMRWLPAEAKWQLQNWTLSNLQDATTPLQSGATLNVALGVVPNDFYPHPNLHETLTLPELNTHIDVLKNRGATNVHLFIIEKYMRYMVSFAAVVLTLLGVVISARKQRNGMGVQIAIGFVVAFMYIVSHILAKGIAEVNGTRLVLTLWMPNAIFSLLGLIGCRWVLR